MENISDVNSYISNMIGKINDLAESPIKGKCTRDYDVSVEAYCDCNQLKFKCEIIMNNCDYEHLVPESVRNVLQTLVTDDDDEEYVISDGAPALSYLFGSTLITMNFSPNTNEFYGRCIPEDCIYKIKWDEVGK